MVRLIVQDEDRSRSARSPRSRSVNASGLSAPLSTTAKVLPPSECADSGAEPAADS